MHIYIFIQSTTKSKLRYNSALLLFFNVIFTSTLADGWLSCSSFSSFSLDHALRAPYSLCCTSNLPDEWLACCSFASFSLNHMKFVLFLLLTLFVVRLMYLIDGFHAVDFLRFHLHHGVHVPYSLCCSSTVLLHILHFSFSLDHAVHVPYLLSVVRPLS